MRIDISDYRDDVIWVDRDSIAHSYPHHMREGFNIHIGRVTIHHDDELVIEQLAHMIATRLGITLPTIVAASIEQPI